MERLSYSEDGRFFVARLSTLCKYLYNFGYGVLIIHGSYGVL